MERPTGVTVSVISIHFHSTLQNLDVTLKDVVQRIYTKKKCMHQQLKVKIVTDACRPQ